MTRLSIFIFFLTCCVIAFRTGDWIGVIASLVLFVPLYMIAEDDDLC